MTEDPQDQQQEQQDDDQSVAEFKEEVENDPSVNPDDEGLDARRGG